MLYIGGIYIYIDGDMGGIYMYIDCVYEVVYTFILIVYMGGIYIYIDCVYEVVYTCLSDARTLIYSTICHGLFVFNCLR